MLDALAILVSCGACLLVAWRAARLDRTLPWFGGPPEPTEDAKPSRPNAGPR